MGFMADPGCRWDFVTRLKSLDALERYLNYLGPGGDGGAICEDLADLFVAMMQAAP